MPPLTISESVPRVLSGSLRGFECLKWKEGIEQARRLVPNIVSMDICMPIMDGIVATEWLSGELPESQVIIMSVRGERAYPRRAMQAGACEYLIKAFSGDELIASIRRVHRDASVPTSLQGADTTLMSLLGFSTCNVNRTC